MCVCTRYQPICLILPPSTTIMKSAACRKCTWWVTRMRVVCCSKPTIHSLYKCLATWTSTAARGSSSKYTSFSCSYCHTVHNSAERCSELHHKTTTSSSTTNQPGFQWSYSTLGWVSRKQIFVTCGASFWATICKVVHPMLSDHCPVRLSCLWHWCIVAKRLDGSRQNLVRR